MKTKYILITLGVLIGMFFLSNFLWFAGDATNVAKQEFSATAMLKKYEWFKDASAQLEKKFSDITVYESNIKIMQEEYAGTERKDWDRLDKQQFNQWRTELAGIKSSYNDLSAEYNAQSSKFNWKGFEGDIPIEYNQLLRE